MIKSVQRYGVAAVAIALAISAQLAVLRFFDDRDPPPYVFLLTIQVAGFAFAVRALQLRPRWIAILAIPYLVLMFVIAFQVGYEWGLYDYP